MAKRTPTIGLAWLTLGAVVACSEPAGELDPDRVREIARTRGDAVGFEFSGTYELRFLPRECGCDGIVATGGLGGANLCSVGSYQGGTLLDELVQADGTLVVRSFSLSGPVYADGTFEVGLVARSETAGFQALQVVYGAGDFSPVSNSGWELRVDLRRHMLIVGENPAVEITPADCVEHVQVVGLRQ